MDPLWMAALGAVLGPLSGIVTGWLLDRRSRKVAELTAETADGATDVSRTEAATHQFEAQVAGWSEYVEKVEKASEKLELRVKDLENRLTRLSRDFGTLTRHLDVVEALVPVESRPPRPIFEFRNDD